MHFLFIILSMLALIGAVICYIIILIDAFQDELWKGLVSLFCYLYLFYYAVTEFEHDYKWGIVLGMVAGGGIAAGLSRMG